LDVIDRLKSAIRCFQVLGPKLRLALWQDGEGVSGASSAAHLLLFLGAGSVGGHEHLPPTHSWWAVVAV